LADHRFEGARCDLSAKLVRGYVDIMNLSIHHAPVLAMTGGALPVQLKSLVFDDRDELSKRAFQAWHATGNSIVELSSLGVLPEMVERKSRQAHVRRTQSGALRASNRERFGSGSARALSM
jgi:hypothetical protein